MHISDKLKKHSVKTNARTCMVGTKQSAIILTKMIKDNNSVKNDLDIKNSSNTADRSSLLAVRLAVSNIRPQEAEVA